MYLSVFVNWCICFFENDEPFDFCEKKLFWCHLNVLSANCFTIRTHALFGVFFHHKAEIGVVVSLAFSRRRKVIHIRLLQVKFFRNFFHGHKGLTGC